MLQKFITATFGCMLYSDWIPVVGGGDCVVGDSVVGDSVVGVAIVSAAVINAQEPGARNVKVAFHFNAQAVVRKSASLQYHCAFSLHA